MVGLHQPVMVPNGGLAPPAAPVLQPPGAAGLLPPQHFLLNGRVQEHLVPYGADAKGVPENASPLPMVKQPSQQQQQQHALHAEVARLSQPSTPITPGHLSQSGTPYTSPAQTPVPMQADPASNPIQEHMQHRQSLSMVSAHLHNTSLDLSRGGGRELRSPVMNGRVDGTPRGTPQHTPAHSPTPTGYPASTTSSQTLADQFQLLPISEVQLKQEVL